MKKFMIIIASFILLGCSGPEKRNSWQEKEDFSNKRSVYYNDFVESGGMIKDDDQVNPVKKQIQSALQQGRVINQIQK